jgi:transposase
LEIDRDLNAAYNILAVGLHSIGTQSVEAAGL